MPADAPRLFVASGIAYPESGGPATYLHQILPALQAQGWQIRLQAYGDPHPIPSPYTIRRIPRRAFPLRLMHYALSAHESLRWADVVYTHTIDLPLYSIRSAPHIIKIVGDQAWERCVRRTWISPDVNIDAFQTGDFGRIVHQQRLSRNRQVRAHDAVIVPSAYLGRMVAGWGVPDERIHVIYNALPPLPQDAPDVQTLRARYQLPDAPFLLTASRLETWKGIDHTLHALHHLPDLHYIIAGDGTDEARLRQLARPLGERVRFLGRVTRADLYALMSMAQYFVLYSGYEGLSHVLLESLRAGTPVIASDKGGNPEVVRDGINGRLVPYGASGDADALLNVLRQSLTIDVRAHLAHNTSAGLGRFDFATMVTQTDALLRGFL